jgi:hypothetical protein
MKLPALMEIRSLYCSQIPNNRPYPKQPNQNHLPYWTNNDVYIILPNTYTFSSIDFSTLNALHHTPFVYGSIISYNQGAVP